MKGLDFAFYRHRNQYHTKYDDVSNLEGPAPLWNMVESALATTKALVEEDDSDDGDSDPVYFDGWPAFHKVGDYRLTYFFVTRSSWRGFRCRHTTHGIHHPPSLPDCGSFSCPGLGYLRQPRQQTLLGLERMD